MNRRWRCYLWLVCSACSLAATYAGSAAASPSDDDFSAYTADSRPPRRTLFVWFGGALEDEAEDEEDTIVTDRPDFTEASSTVGRGVRQVEMGYTFTTDNDGTTRFVSHSFPEMLWRVGMFADWFEFRIAFNVGAQQTTAVGIPQVTASGVEDLYLGAKIGLTEQDGWLPEMAIIPQMTVPIGVDAITGGRVQPGVNWLYGWDINDFLATGGSTQYNRAVDDSGAAFNEFAQSWTVNYNLAENLGAYTEWFAFFPAQAVTAQPQHYFDAGFTYLLSNDVQLDIRAGIGLNNAANDFFAGSGISIRF